MDKIEVYKTKRRGSATPACQTLLTFDYKTPTGGSVTFQYKECGGIVNTATYELPPSEDFSTFDAFDLYEICFEVGTLVRIAGLPNVTNFTYGTCP